MEKEAEKGRQRCLLRRGIYVEAMELGRKKNEVTRRNVVGPARRQAMPLASILKSA